MPSFSPLERWDSLALVLIQSRGSDRTVREVDLRGLDVAVESHGVLLDAISSAAASRSVT